MDNESGMGEIAPPPSPEAPRAPERADGMFRVPVGDGTLLDNYLILRVKEEKFAGDPERLKAVQREMDLYRPAVQDLTAGHQELDPLLDELQDIHRRLWYIEDRKRELERAEDEAAVVERLTSPGSEDALREYLTLSRQVSLFNDRRAALKRKMNAVTGSAIVEVKSHKTVE